MSNERNHDEIADRLRPFEWCGWGSASHVGPAIGVRDEVP